MNSYFIGNESGMNKWRSWATPSVVVVDPTSILNMAWLTRRLLQSLPWKHRHLHSDVCQYVCVHFGWRLACGGCPLFRIGRVREWFCPCLDAVELACWEIGMWWWWWDSARCWWWSGWGWHCWWRGWVRCKLIVCWFCVWWMLDSNLQSSWTTDDWTINKERLLWRLRSSVPMLGCLERSRLYSVLSREVLCYILNTNAIARVQMTIWNTRDIETKN